MLMSTTRHSSHTAHTLHTHCTLHTTYLGVVHEIGVDGIRRADPVAVDDKRGDEEGSALAIAIGRSGGDAEVLAPPVLLAPPASWVEPLAANAVDIGLLRAVPAESVLQVLHIQTVFRQGLAETSQCLGRRHRGYTQAHPRVPDNLDDLQV